MKVKLIAIGNRIMGDDSIGIRVAEELYEKINNENIKLVIAETDAEYALNELEDDDFLFIIDSTNYGKNTGTVTFTPIPDLKFTYKAGFSQHEPSLLHLIKQYNKKVNGYVIGIEINNIEFSLNLSYFLQKNFTQICEEIFESIKAIKNNL